MTLDPAIFRDYDIRAKVPSQLDDVGVEKLTKALIFVVRPKVVAIGRDKRLSSERFYKVMERVFITFGVDVVNLGLVTTDMVYYASGRYKFDLAISITGSHNPPEYNGFKLVRAGAVAISGRSGIYDVKDAAFSGEEPKPVGIKLGKTIKLDITDEWIEHVLKFIDMSKIKKKKIVIDTGNGMAGLTIPRLFAYLPEIKVIPLFFDIDCAFPNHIPNPLIEEFNEAAIKTVLSRGADFGILFDGDGDRMFFVDEKGNFINGTLTTAMIIDSLAKKYKNEVYLYNAVCGRIVPEIIKKHGVRGIRVRVGHTLIKEDMKKFNAIFAGEHSGHYFFRDNYYADSGLIAALIVLELISLRDLPLSKLVSKYQKYASSGEINFVVHDKQAVMKFLEKEYKGSAQSVDWLDGVSVWFKNWWFNLRPSNTQPLLRLNVEADNDQILQKEKKAIIKKIIAMGARQQQND